MTRDASFSAADNSACAGATGSEGRSRSRGMAANSPLSQVTTDGHAEAARRGRRDETGRKRPVAVDDIERAVVLQRRQERGVLAQHAGRPPEVANHRAEQRIAARLLVVAKRVDEHVVLPRQPLDQPEHGGNHLFAAASIDAAGHDEGDSHARPLFHTTGRDRPSRQFRLRPDPDRSRRVARAVLDVDRLERGAARGGRRAGRRGAALSSRAIVTRNGVEYRFGRVRQADAGRSRTRSRSRT